MTLDPDRRTPEIDPRLLDRARGCAVGAAVGDALGMPLEFKPRRSPGNLICDMIPGRLPAGAFTDDTEMALALAESLLSRRPLDLDDLARRFAAWAMADPPDIGIQTSRALRRIAQGEPWETVIEEEQRRHPDAAGNGSLMRCWPVALAYWDDLDALLRDSERQSRVTHPHPDCVAACVLINATIYGLLHGASPEEALYNAASLARLGEPLEQTLRAAKNRSREELTNSGWVRHTVESAVWGLLNTDTFEDALVSVVNLGNDADTAGAVAGALAGAAYGLAAIPERWKTALRGEWPLRSGAIWTVNNVIDMADRLIRLAVEDV